MLRQSNIVSLKAFTVIEAVMGMLVTALIIAVVFIIYNITAQRLLDFKKQNDVAIDMNRFTYAVNKDIFESEDIQVHDQGMSFYGFTGRKVAYHIDRDYIVRSEATFTDTFFISVKRVFADTLFSEDKTKCYYRVKVVTTDDKEDFDLNFYRRVYPQYQIK